MKQDFYIFLFQTIIEILKIPWAFFTKTRFIHIRFSFPFLLYCVQVKGRQDAMKTEKEIIKEQEKYIQEMEHYISILEEANARQKQTIEMLEQHNTVLQQHYEQYVDTVHRMMKDLES